jgi:hypothetical protein
VSSRVEVRYRVETWETRTTENTRKTTSKPENEGVPTTWQGKLCFFVLGSWRIKKIDSDRRKTVLPDLNREDRIKIRMKFQYLLPYLPGLYKTLPIRIQTG